MQPDAIQAGVHSLLKSCAGLKPGDHLLVVGEAGPGSYFEPGLCMAVARIAEAMYINVQVIMAGPVSGADNFPPRVAEAMPRADASVFFSRLGDQVRFVTTPGAGKKIICYAVTAKHFAAPFATLDHQKMTRIHDRLKDRILSSKGYEIRAPCGTRLTGQVHRPAGDDGEDGKDGKDGKDGGDTPAPPAPPATSEFQVDLFPVMIFPPLNCHRLSGHLVLKDFLTSSSTRAYRNSAFLIDSAIHIRVEDSQMVAFAGDAGEIKAVKGQMERAAEITGGDPYALNSWHTGINPGTFFEGNPRDDLERWGTVAFGSPRVTHFHACGRDPGDVAIHLLNASITFDGQPLWENGRFAFLDEPEVESMLSLKERAILGAGHSLGIGIGTGTDIGTGTGIGF